MSFSENKEVNGQEVSAEPISAESATAAASESVPTQPPVEPQRTAPSNPPVNLDTAVFIQLFRNPLQAGSFGQDKLIYGIIGLCASVIAYTLFGFSITRMPKLPGIDLSMFIKNTSIPEIVFKSFFFGGIVSLVAFVAAFSLFGAWIGKTKLDFKAVVVKYGSLQILTAAGFLAAAILSLILPSLGDVVKTFTIGMTLVLTALMTLEIFAVEAKDRFKLMTFAVGSYCVVQWIFTSAI